MSKGWLKWHVTRATGDRYRAARQRFHQGNPFLGGDVANTADGATVAIWDAQVAWAEHQRAEGETDDALLNKILARFEDGTAPKVETITRGDGSRALHADLCVACGFIPCACPSPKESK